MKYADARWHELSWSGDALSPEERAEGWHYCQDFDLDLCPVEADGKCRWCGSVAVLVGEDAALPREGPE